MSLSKTAEHTVTIAKMVSVVLSCETINQLETTFQMVEAQKRTGQLSKEVAFTIGLFIKTFQVKKEALCKKD